MQKCCRTASVIPNSIFDTMHMYNVHRSFFVCILCAGELSAKLKWTAVIVPFLVMHSHKNFDRIQFGLFWKRDICSFQSNGISNEISALQTNWIDLHQKYEIIDICCVYINWKYMRSVFILNELVKSCRLAKSLIFTFPKNRSKLFIVWLRVFASLLPFNTLSNRIYRKSSLFYEIILSDLIFEMVKKYNHSSFNVRTFDCRMSIQKKKNSKWWIFVS